MCYGFFGGNGSQTAGGLILGAGLLAAETDYTKYKEMMNKEKVQEELYYPDAIFLGVIVPFMKIGSWQCLDKCLYMYG